MRGNLSVSRLAVKRFGRNHPPVDNTHVAVIGAAEVLTHRRIVRLWPTEAKHAKQSRETCRLRYSLCRLPLPRLALPALIATNDVSLTVAVVLSAAPVPAPLRADLAEHPHIDSLIACRRCAERVRLRFVRRSSIGGCGRLILRRSSPVTYFVVFAMSETLSYQSWIVNRHSVSHCAAHPSE